MTIRLCRACKDWHDLSEPWPSACAAHFGFRQQGGPQIVRDIEPYRSIITGERIAGRKQHRDHLRAHRCIEVGNEQPKAMAPAYAGGLAEDIKRSMEALSGRR